VLLFLISDFLFPIGFIKMIFIKRKVKNGELKQRVQVYKSIRRQSTSDGSHFAAHFRKQACRCTNRLWLIIALLTALLFIIGCPPVKPETAQPSGTEPNDTQPFSAKPAETEPPKVEPTEIKPPETEPPEVKPPEVKPSEVKPTKTKPSSAASFHEKCADILNTYVDSSGMVDYETLKRKRLELKHLLDEFENLERDVYDSWSKEDKIAFWINTYNTQMLNIIVKNYPIQSSRWLRLLWPPNSIRHIKGIWSKYKFLVMDEEFTLLRIEQQFFRKKFDEPRVFFALCQASLSSPPLRNKPYYGDKLYQQLDDQVKKFLSSPKAFKIDRDNQMVCLSAMFKPTWFGKEFVRKYNTDKKFKDKEPVVRAVLNFITNYVPEQDVNFLELENYSVEYMKYDWKLNEQ
jgi:hypothetical protein